MKILSEIFKRQPKQHFFLFANNTIKDERIEKMLWSSSDFLSKQSVCILFNTACPLEQYPVVQKHQQKWIFFRLLAMHQKYGTHFRDLDVLNRYIFTKFYFLPDMLDPKYHDKYFMKPTMEYLLNSNIDVSRLCHLNLIDHPAIRTIKYIYPKNSDSVGTMSTGMWVYLYLRYAYPSAMITLVNYTMDIGTDYHNSAFERGFLFSEIISGRCGYMGSLLEE